MKLKRVIQKPNPKGDILFHYEIPSAVIEGLDPKFSLAEIVNYKVKNFFLDDVQNLSPNISYILKPDVDEVSFYLVFDKMAKAKGQAFKYNNTFYHEGIIEI